jgi:hypothetical protein
MLQPAEKRLAYVSIRQPTPAYVSNTLVDARVLKPAEKRVKLVYEDSSY